MSGLDIVGTTIGSLTHSDHHISLFAMLCLSHEEEVGNFFFGESVEYIEIFYRHKNN